MNILIVFASIEGQTRKIAEFLKFEAGKLKQNCVICDINAGPPNPENYDAVLIGASIHSGKYQPAIQDYIHAYKQALNVMHSGFFSVSLSAISDDGQLWQELKDATDQLLNETGWKPGVVEYMAGALRNTQYDFFEKFIVRTVARKASPGNDRTHDSEFTDWPKAQLFLKNFIDRWVPRPITLGQQISDQEAVG